MWPLVTQLVKVWQGGEVRGSTWGVPMSDGRGGVGTAYEGGYERRDAHNQGTGSQRQPVPPTPSF